jgi:hypothetical protein
MSKQITYSNHYLSARFFILALAVFCITTLHAQRYVSVGGAGNKDGSTWADAYDEGGFRVALKSAASGDQFWLMMGTYKPENFRDSAFTIPNGVKLYGGFSVTDTVFSDRDWKANETILSGDIGSAGVTTDNSYHVVKVKWTDTSTVLDGFTVSDGRASGAGLNRNAGGGVYIDGGGSGNSSAMTIRNCLITKNFASGDGGGVLDYGALDGNVSSMVINCVFASNSGGNGGGMYSAGYNGNNTGTANSTIINCIFINNTSVSLGGGAHTHANLGVVKYINCTFTGNTSGGGGSAYHVYKGDTYVSNCIFHANPGTDVGKNAANANIYLTNSVVQGGFATGNNVITHSPLFSDSISFIGADNIWGTADDGLHLSLGSPAANYGINDSMPADILLDIDHNNRIKKNTIDLGAFESDLDCNTMSARASTTYLCSGNQASFYVTTDFAGSKDFQWQVNGSDVGNLGDTIYTTTSLADGDQVQCLLASSYTCTYPDHPSTNIMDIKVETPPSVSITGSLCQGTTLTASGVQNASQIYWSLNGNIVGWGVKKSLGSGSTKAGDAAGNAGSDSTMLSGPAAIARDENGNIYIADLLNNRVQLWTPGASYGITVAGDPAGTSGNDSTKLNKPNALFLDNDGSLYIADGFNHRIQKWKSGASYGTTVAGGSFGNGSSQLSFPNGVFVDLTGNIYISDYNNNRVQKWEPGATTGTTVAGDASGASGSDSTQLNGPLGIYVDAAGTIYISDSKNHRIQSWTNAASYGTTMAGDKNGTAGSDSVSLNNPSGIFMDGARNLYIADRNNHRIMKYPYTSAYGFNVAGDAGNTSGSTSNKLNSPSGVYVSHFGNVYVADLGNNRVQEWFQEFSDSTFTPTVTGSYQLNVVTPSGCAVQSNAVNVTTAAIPTVTINASKTTICGGDNISFTASTTDGGSSPAFQWYKNGTPAGTNDSTFASNLFSNNDTISCQLTSSISCVTSSTMLSNKIGLTVNVIPVATLAASGNTTICAGDSLKINANADAGNYIWLLNGNNISSGSDSIYYAKNTGDYSVISANGACADTSSILVVTVLPQPTVTLTPASNQSICQGDSVKITATTNVSSFQWYDGVNIINAATDSIYVAKSSGTYSVKVSDGTCNTLSSSVQVTVNAYPTASITPASAQTICQGDSVNLQANSGNNYTYQWYNNTTSISNEINANLNVKNAGSYTVTVTNNGCSATSGATVVSVNPLPSVPTISKNLNILTSSNASGYQWYLNGAKINGATNKTYSPTQSGKFQVEITDANGCKNISAEFNFLIGINNIQTDLNVSITPNPGQNSFNLEISQLIGAGKIVVYDMAGKEIMIRNAEAINTFDMTAQATGMYIIKVYTRTNTTSLRWIKL